MPKLAHTPVTLHDAVAEWVGLHYKVNFEAEPEDRQQVWTARYLDSNFDKLFVAITCWENGFAINVHPDHTTVLLALADELLAGQDSYTVGVLNGSAEELLKAAVAFEQREEDPGEAVALLGHFADGEFHDAPDLPFQETNFFSSNRDS